MAHGKATQVTMPVHEAAKHFLEGALEQGEVAHSEFHPQQFDRHELSGGSSTCWTSAAARIETVCWKNRDKESIERPAKSSEQWS